MRTSILAPWSVLAAAIPLVAVDALAQNTAAPQTIAATPAGDTTTAPPPIVDPHASDPDRLLDREGTHWGLGVRGWAFITPPFLVGLFAHVEPGWGGGVNPAVGPELSYRNGQFEADFGVMYTGYNAPTGVFHGLDEPPNASELVMSSLYAIFGTATLLYGIRVTNYFEVQVGGGIGIGGVGGDLLRTQAYHDTDDSTKYHDCIMQGGPAGASLTAEQQAFCGGDNDHYSGQSAAGTAHPRAANTPYREPSWLDNPAGSRPVVLPWVALPHIALHFQPAAHFDFKLEGGFALTGFFGGASLHYLF